MWSAWPGAKGPARCLPARAGRHYLRDSLISLLPKPLNHTAPHALKVSGRPRVHAEVALRLLEILKSQDVPPEVFEDENLTVTMPRRLGLSDVVERQIRTYRHDTRKGVRLRDQEIHDLFRLVARRPDADEIFLLLGRKLAGEEESSWWRRRMPVRVRLALARRRVTHRLKTLFGRRLGGFGRGSFTVEGRSLLFFEVDSGGDACALVTGLCASVLEQVTGKGATVSHTLCQSRDDALCRWEGAVAATGHEGG